ncbi:4'-phosphopantetheinyl transferase family protein [Anaerotignum sp.]
MNGLLYMNVRILENKEAFQKGMRLISGDRRNKILSLKNDQPARLSLGAGLLLRIALERMGYLKYLNNIQYGKHGKPYISNLKFHFSLSHSGDYAVCAYSDSPIGMDLQKIKSKIPENTKRILSDSERLYLQNQNKEIKIETFYRFWAIKESIIKWDGRGLRLPLQDISLVEQERIVDQISFEGKQLFLKEYDTLFPDYALSICSENESFRCKAEEITLEFLIQD